MVNRELFYKVADVIERHPDRYDQAIWGHGSLRDIAGHAAALAGAVSTDDCDWTVVRRPDGRMEYVDEYAQEVLGIDEDDAERLFGTFWAPPEDMDVPEALRAIGDGASVEEVTR